MSHEKGIYFPDRENLAREINNIICYYDLSAELIADEIFNNKENDASISAAIIDVIAERQRQISGVGDDGDPNGKEWSAAPVEYREDGSILYQVGGLDGEVIFEEDAQ